MMDVEAAAGQPLATSAAVWARSRAWIGGWWLAGRGIVIATALAAHAFGPHGHAAHFARGHALGLLSSWDGWWYRIVASDGYLLVPGRQSDPAFFPLFPALLRGAHAFGIGYATAGIAIANLALLVGLVAFDELTSDLLGATLARRATTYVAIFPFGYVFSMAYPESVVFTAMALAGLAALRNRWGFAAVFAAAAALARPEGLFLVLPLAALAWQRRRRLSPEQRGLAFGASAACVGAFAAYPLYLDRVLHDPTAWNRAERAWGRHFSPLGAVRAIEHLGRAFDGNAWVVRDVVAAVLYVALLAAAAKAGVPRAWLAAGAAIVLLPLFSGAFTSIGRFGLLALPVFWGLAWVGRRRRVDILIRAASVVLLVGATMTIPFVFP